MEDLFSPAALHITGMVLLKMGIAVGLGGAIGFERERHGRPAGLRTHMLVALGVVLFCIVSAAFPGSDPTRISAQVVTGIGFLGAGTIMRLGSSVRGLTSAASIWATSAISMAVARGGPYVVVAVVSTGMALITLGTIEQLEKKFRPVQRSNELHVTLKHRDELAALVARLNNDGFEVGAVRTVSKDSDNEFAIEVAGSGSAVIQSACAVRGVVSARWTDHG